MVSSVRPETETTSGNPLDLVEQIAIANEWPFHRQTDDELAAEIGGHWCQYRLWFAWHQDVGVMHISCALEMRIPANKRDAIYHLLALANEKLWLGHFDLWSDEQLIVFRHAVLVRDGNSVGVDTIEDLLEIATGECERFYPAFQFSIWGGKAPHEALSAAMLETEGEA
ncbi:MAG: YbjN domain-containing protein [Geminicoccaceae bacterium]